MNLTEHIILKSVVQIFEELHREKMSSQKLRIQDIDACDVTAVTCDQPKLIMTVWRKFGRIHSPLFTIKHQESQLSMLIDVDSGTL